MPITSYDDALTYFYSYVRFNPNDITRWSLDRLKELLARLGDPHKSFPSLLIAGTKGKGSTSAICESILREAGYKTGLYTSPHVHSFRERIRVGGELITEEELITLANKLKPYFEATPDLTAFELITTVAFVAFAEANIDAAVLEVGLGGRLDATNAVDPTVAVITSISYDHTQILGETLSLIAREKAGIIRPGALVISSPQVDEARQMIEEVCRERQARLIMVDRDWTWQINEYGLDGQSFTLNGHSYWLPLMGEHQAVNAITAVTAVRGFSQVSGLQISPESEQAGLAQIRWLGRMELLSKDPFLILDSAMNGDSAEKLVDTLKRYFEGCRITFIFGASSDHPVDAMLKTFQTISDQMFVTAADHPRAETPKNLAALAAQMGYEVIPIADVAGALDAALTNAGKDDVICASGSLFLVAGVREAWMRRNNMNLPPIDTKHNS